MVAVPFHHSLSKRRQAVVMKIVITTMLFFAARTAAFSPSIRSPVAARAFSRTAAALAENPKVFFDMEVGGEDVGRIEFELRSDVVPKTGSFFFKGYYLISPFFRALTALSLLFQLKTSELSALARRGSGTRVPHSIA